MVKRALLEFSLDYNNRLVISGDTPNGRENVFDISIRLNPYNIDCIFPCYYNGRVYIFYPSSKGDSGYSIYDGATFSDYISIPEFGNRKLLTAVSVDDGIVVLAKNRDNDDQVYQMIKFKNGEWMDFENIKNLKGDYEADEQFCGASVDGEARVLLSRENLQFITSSDNFQNPLNLISDGAFIATSGPIGCSISAEISSFNYIISKPEYGSVGIYLQDDKTHIRRLGAIKVSDIEMIEGTTIYRISVNKFKIYIVGIDKNNIRKAYHGEFNINNLESGLSETVANESLLKYLSAWITVGY